MINRKFLLAAVAALSICLAFAGCGDTGETGGAKNADTTTAVLKAEGEDVSEAEEITEESVVLEEPEQESEEEVQSEPEDSSEAQEESEEKELSSYELIALEWDKGLRTYTTNNSEIRGLGACEADNGKVIIWSLVPVWANGATSMIYTYDPETKETTELCDYMASKYYNGYLYWSNPAKGILRKYDTDGLVLSNENLGIALKADDIAVTDEGEVAVLTKDGAKQNLTIVSADFQTKTNYDPPQKEAEHGHTEDIPMLHVIGYYNNRIYVDCDEPGNKLRTIYLYSFDMDTHEWEKMVKLPTIPADLGEVIGKYWVFPDDRELKGYIMDLETGKIIEETPARETYRNYVGGDRPANFSVKDATVCPVNENAYVMSDEYGIFYRAAGEDEVEIVSFK